MLEMDCCLAQVSQQDGDFGDIPLRETDFRPSHGISMPFRYHICLMGQNYSPL